MSEDNELRDRFPGEVYGAEADFVRLAIKTMTAKRMVGWLREYAEYAEVSGADKTAEHSRNIANRIATELPDEEPIEK